MTTRGTALRTKRGGAARRVHASALPERCACCLRTIDWSGLRQPTAPGLLEDEFALCNSCAWQAAETALAGSAIEAV